MNEHKQQRRDEVLEYTVRVSMKTFFGESNTFTITFPVPYFVFDTRHARGERTRVNGCGIYCLCIQYPSVRGRGAWCGWFAR